MCACCSLLSCFVVFFFFNDTATTEIYTLSLHDALPISSLWLGGSRENPQFRGRCRSGDRKSTRLNSSHTIISYAVFCLKKKKKTTQARLYLRYIPTRLPADSTLCRCSPRCHLLD